ncbi:response regulator transcription factor [bacterium]|nr:response regulator transcription factor [bacterium]
MGECVGEGCGRRAAADHAGCDGVGRARGVGDGGRLNVVVCDDSQDDVDAVERCARELCASLGVPVSVRTYTDGSLLLDEWACDADFLFLDMEMPIASGLEVARELRARDAAVTLVFVTSHERYALSGYEVGAYRYLLKPLRPEAFARQMGEAFRRARDERAARLLVRGDGCVRAVAPREVLYVETRPNHRLVVHTDDGELGCYGRLAQVAQELGGPAFFRCHASCLVNLARVRELGREALVLDDGTTVPVSRHRRADMLQALLAFSTTLVG